MRVLQGQILTYYARSIKYKFCRKKPGKRIIYYFEKKFLVSWTRSLKLL